MADALVSAVLETVVGMLGSAALEEVSLVWGLKDEIDKLESVFGTIQAVLHDAELQQRKSEPRQNWLRKLKDAACDAENILDRIATEGLRRQANSERGKLPQLNSILSVRNPLLFRLKMVRKVKNITKKLDALAEERHKFHLGECVMENRFGVTLESRITTSLVNETEIYGRSEDKEVIMEKLLAGSCSEDDLCVHAIQGMGGLGKTTLAQMVYSDERTQRRFDLRIWVCVSDDFSVAGIVRAILESIEGGGCNISALDPLQRRLQEKLRGRRYLLVLDDIWNENQRLWDALKEVLRCGSQGSVTIVTTRIEKVASMMSTTGIHRINYLSEDDSWALFKQRAFSNEEGEDNFIAIGKVIVKKCGGVPLAIKALGSLMRLKSHEREWIAVKESEMWNLSDDENAILPALRIPSDGPTDMHLTGQLIFKELVWRSFLQDAQINFKGNMSCKMHDLMHDLASSVMKHEIYILEYNKKLQIPKTVHHLSFRNVPDDKSVLKLPIDHSLRSMIVHEGNVPAWRKGFWPLLSKQKYLRALDVHHFDIEMLPNFVCKLEHLRYLAMACNNMKMLPESLTNLHNLQTLKLTDSEELLELPKDLKMMKNLWFLEMERFGSLLCTPPGLRNLTCLRRLSIFIVGEDESHQIDQLKDLELGGKLSIQGLDNIRTLQDARSANLVTKSSLTCLSLSWKKGIKMECAEHFEEVLQGLQPHQNIEKISIASYHGSRFPGWMSTLVFQKLKEISLEDCPRCEHLPPLGKLPSLTCLSLYKMNSIKCLDGECYGDGETSFPALTRLEIWCMPNFERWTINSAKVFLPCLDSLDIHLCPKLAGLPELPTLKRLSISSSSTSILKSITFLTSLTSLNISNFPELVVLPTGLLQNLKALEILNIGSLPIQTLSNVLDNVSALKRLSFDSCHNLEFLPEDFKYLSSLEWLDISGSDGLRSFPTSLLKGLCSLRSLWFQNCKKLKPLLGPLERSPPALRDLGLNGLPELEYLPENVQLLTSLEELRIWNCKKLKSLPDGFKDLTSVRTLDIRGCAQLEKRCKNPKVLEWLDISACDGLRSFPTSLLKGLCSLRSLWFQNCKKLKPLLGPLERSPPALRNLLLNGLPELEYLPENVQLLTSLEELRIWNCEKLKSLPEGFKDLTSLRELEIVGCAQLEKRCKNPKGEDWHKISHIPIIKINGNVIQHLD
ncbi:hypothetical protein ACS0TY_008616 [Phlomoides rotata]